jgi:competence/damage-inducible protein CinA-like protein
LNGSVNAEIITVGDELLIGQVINTNQAYIAERLNLIGIHVAAMMTVGDRIDEIVSAFDEARERWQVVVVTGGLGPTHDDVTKNALCRLFDTDLVTNESLRDHIAVLLGRRNIAWNPSAEDQARVPRRATILPNPVGTAPGMLFRDGGKFFIVLPGVPYEMKEIIDGSVIPLLKSSFSGTAICHRTLRTTGIAESMLAQKLGKLDDLLDRVSLAFLPSPTGVRLRLSAHDTDEQQAMERIRSAEEKIRNKVGRYIYGTETEELEEVLGRLLADRKVTIAVAESCTGGHIADRLTNVSGSSAYFERGVVTYSNASKTALLNVPPALIERHGAVSREVAEAMAVGVRLSAGTDLGLSTTGIAGPTGGTPEKPVGLVWVGYADAAGTIAQKFQFGDGRIRFKERAAQAALECARRRILHLE